MLNDAGVHGSLLQHGGHAMDACLSSVEGRPYQWKYWLLHRVLEV